MVINGGFIGGLAGGLLGYALFGRWLGKWLDVSALLAGSSTPPLSADGADAVAYIAAAEALDGRRTAFLAFIVAGVMIGAFVCWYKKRAARV